MDRDGTVNSLIGVQVLGTLTGKIIEISPGDYILHFTKVQIGNVVEAQVREVWQIYPGGIPVYIEGGLKIAAETVIPLLGQSDSSLRIDPVDVKILIELLARTGFGFDNIASVGVYGKGTSTLEMRFPVLDTDTSLYSNASFGLDAKIFCLKADYELYKAKNDYLFGEPDENSVAMMELSLAEDSTWEPQSRDYLNATELLFVGLFQ